MATVPGVVYLKPSPEEEYFKSAGDAVAAGDTLALVEVMKSFIPLTAPSDGTFVGYLVENEQPVDPGQAIAELG
ncbi:biotin carboxyl carrier domain-containing protein [Pseudohoeflea sp. DP4N28-3]|uniref:Biotin carboxyl carrier domain-containing protein n=2 Tax=Pseudohoeflea coraliihabitans TaxID=2860393 RepID=A0ABS6WPY6_9HYPH|nr:biotin carboxyl carrier domain-containing protein [Pseudohoeflea sp. DP4N28-3]